MKHGDKFDAFDTHSGKYSARKVPKWQYSPSDVMEYLRIAEEGDNPNYEASSAHSM